MKICVSEKKRFLPHYLIFCLLLALSFVIFFLIGSIFTPNKSPENLADSDTYSSSQTSDITVVIDAGHGGEDCGAIGTNGTYEKDINLSIALKLCEMLRVHGIKTVMTRTDDILLYDKNSNYHGQKKVQDLANRRAIAESYENIIFISIHMNAFPESKYNGLQVYYSANDPTSKELAQNIQDITRELLMPENNRKIKMASSNIYLLDRLKQPAVLIECGFLSNPLECEKLSSEEYRQQIAFLIYFAIIDHLEKINKITQTGT